MDISKFVLVVFISFSFYSAVSQTLYIPGGSVGSSSNGNVGIGTSNPDSKLEVVGPSTGTGAAIRASGGGDILMNNGGSLFFDGNYSYASGSYIRPMSQNTQAFFTSGAERLRIAASGFIGIGTPAPADQLEIVSGFRKVGFNTLISGISNGGVLSLSRGDDGAKIMLFGASEAPNDDPVIYGNGGGTELRFVSGGGGSTGFGFYTNINHQVAFGSSRPVPLVKIDGAGKVGIGTGSPTTKLEIQGGGSTSVDLKVNGRIQTGDGANYGGMWVSTTSNMFIGQNNATQLGFYNNGAWRLIADNNGNVGIGTTSPNQKLTVNGTIYGKEVKVDLSVPGPDYVFDENYKLPSLEEIKSYIDLHKHLPEVPSAKEMEANGINVGEMNMILLKKIEELTLYMIEQQKLNEAQTQEIKELRKMIH